MKKWKAKLDLSGIFYDESMTFIERRDAIVARIRAAGWFKRAVADGSAQYDYEVGGIVDELADTETADDFDIVWDGFYDWADADHRLWIELGLQP